MTLSTLEREFFRQAKNYWEGIKLGAFEPDSTESLLPSFQNPLLPNEYIQSYGLALSHLSKTHQIRELQLDNCHHEKYLKIALAIHQNMNPTQLPKDDQEIGWALLNTQTKNNQEVNEHIKPLNKGLVIGLRSAIARNGLGAEAFSNLLSSKNDEEAISLEKLQECYPNGIPEKDIPTLLNSNLSTDARLFLYDATLSDLKKQPMAVGASQASALRKSIQSEKKPEYMKACRRLVDELSASLSEYWNLSSQDQSKESRLHAISNQFDQLNGLLDIDLKIEQFRDLGYDQIRASLQQQIHYDSIANQAYAMQQFTDDVVHRSTCLSRDIQDYLQYRESLDEKKNSLTSLNQNIMFFYENKMKQKTKWSSIIRKIKCGFDIVSAGASAASLAIPPSAPICGTIATVASISSTSLSTAHNFLSHQSENSLRDYENQLQTSKQAEEILGVLSEQTIKGLMALQEEKVQELQFLLDHKEFVKPSDFRNLLGESLNYIEKDTKDKQEEIQLQKDNALELEKSQQHYQSLIEQEKKKKKPNQSKINDYSLNCKKIEGELTAKQISVEILEKKKESNDLLLKKGKSEHELSEHVAQMADYRFSLQQKCIQIDQKTRRAREEIKKAFDAMREYREHNYKNRKLVLDNLAPIADDLDFWFESNGFKKSLEALSLVDGFQIKLRQLNDFDTQFKETQKKFKLQGIRETVEKMGTLALIEEGIVPLLGIIHTGFLIYRLGYSIWIGEPSANEKKKDPYLESLKLFLNHNQKLLNHRFDYLQETLSKQNQQLYNEIQILKDRLQEGTIDILRGISDSELRIEGKIDKINFNQYKNSILEYRQNFELAEFDIQNLKKRLFHIKEENRNGEGVLAAIDDPINLDCMIDNPSFYTGYLFKELCQNKQATPNLYLFHSFMNGFFSWMDQKFSIQDGLLLENKEIIKEVVDQAIKDLEPLSSLFEIPMKEAEKLYENRMIVLKEIQKKREQSAAFKIKTQNEGFTAAKNHPHSLSSFLQKRVGADKFRINRLMKQPMKGKESLIDSNFWSLEHHMNAREHQFFNYVWVQQLPLNNIHNFAANLLVREPLFLLLNRDGRREDTLHFLKNLSWSAAKQKASDLNPFTIENDRTNARIYQARINQFFQHEVSKIDEAKAMLANSDFLDKKMSAWNAISILKSKVTSQELEESIKLTEVKLQQSYGIPLREKAKSVSKTRIVRKTEGIASQVLLQIKVCFDLNNNKNTICKTTKRSYLHLSDISKISCDYLLNPDGNEKQYQIAIDKLLNDYVSFLDFKFGKTKRNNPNNLFNKISKEDQIIFPKNQELIPLVFSSNLLDHLENYLSHDRFVIESNGIGTLIPSYSLRNCEENQHHELVIGYDVIYLDGRQQQPFCEFLVHRFDSKIIDAFRPITSDNNTLTIGKPNLNEFLIQAMYTTFTDHIGLPSAEKSIRLQEGKGDLVAPKEEFFEGIYTISKKNPDLSPKKNPINQLKIEIESEIKHREFKKGMAFGKYLKQYQLLQAYLKLASGMDRIESEQFLERSLKVTNPDSVALLYLEIEHPKFIENTPNWLDFKDILQRKQSVDCEAICSTKKNLHQVLEWTTTNKQPVFIH